MPAKPYCEPMQRLLAFVALTAALTLSACTTPAPVEPSPTTSEPAASPSVEPEVLVDTLVIRAAGFDLVAEGETVDTLSATDLAGTVDGLTALLGAPQIEVREGGECSTPGDTYFWGEALRIDEPGSLVGAYSSRAFATSVTGTDGQEISIEAAGGAQVGDDIAAIIADTDPELIEGFEESAIVLLETDWFDSDYTVGVAAFTDAGVVINIGMPIAVNSGADC